MWYRARMQQIPPLSRRHAVLAGIAGALASAGSSLAAHRQPADTAKGPGGPCVIASGNGLRCVQRATELLSQGIDPADAVVDGVRIIEDDPDDMSVGLGGLPNAEGVVELDASIMYGPTHKSGAVASVRGIKNVARLALAVLRKTDHALLVGDGAVRFARMQGFVEENLLTEKAREAWVKWREQLGKDAYLSDDERDPTVGKPLPQERKSGPGISAGPRDLEFTYGTVHCSALTAAGDISSCTTTSGLSWKIPGRVGDSPIIGAGNFCDNNVGAAGCTGRGEAAIANLSAHTIVMLMERGMTPAEATMEAAQRVADHTKERRLRDAQGRPTFNISFYAVRKDGLWGGACILPGGSMAVADRQGARVVTLPALFPS